MEAGPTISLPNIIREGCHEDAYDMVNKNNNPGLPGSSTMTPSSASNRYYYFLCVKEGPNQQAHVLIAHSKLDLAERMAVADLSGNLKFLSFWCVAFVFRAENFSTVSKRLPT